MYVFVLIGYDRFVVRLWKKKKRAHNKRLGGGRRRYVASAIFRDVLWTWGTADRWAFSKRTDFNSGRWISIRFDIPRLRIWFKTLSSGFRPRKRRVVGSGIRLSNYTNTAIHNITIQVSGLKFLWTKIPGLYKNCSPSVCRAGPVVPQQRGGR